MSPLHCVLNWVVFFTLIQITTSNCRHAIYATTPGMMTRAVLIRSMASVRRKWTAFSETASWRYAMMPNPQTKEATVKLSKMLAKLRRQIHKRFNGLSLWWCSVPMCPLLDFAMSSIRQRRRTGGPSGSCWYFSGLHSPRTTSTTASDALWAIRWMLPQLINISHRLLIDPLIGYCRDSVIHRIDVGDVRKQHVVCYYEVRRLMTKQLDCWRLYCW